GAGLVGPHLVRDLLGVSQHPVRGFVYGLVLVVPDCVPCLFADDLAQVAFACHVEPISRGMATGDVAAGGGGEVYGPHVGAELCHVERGVDLAAVRYGGFLVTAHPDTAVPFVDECCDAAHVRVVLRFGPGGAVARVLGFDAEGVRIVVLAAVDFAGVPAAAGCDHVPGAIKADAELCERTGQSVAPVSYNTQRGVVAGRLRLVRACCVVGEDALDGAHAAVAAGLPPVDFHNFQASVTQHASEAGVIGHT